MLMESIKGGKSSHGWIMEATEGLQNTLLIQRLIIDSIYLNCLFSSFQSWLISMLVLGFPLHLNMLYLQSCVKTYLNKCRIFIHFVWLMYGVSLFIITRLMLWPFYFCANEVWQKYSSDWSSTRIRAHMKEKWWSHI